MSEKDKPEDALMQALDSLTGLIAQHQGDRLFPLRHADLNLEGIEFGPAIHEEIPLLNDIVGTPTLAIPSPRDVEMIVDHYLDLRLPELREQLKREIFIALRKRFPGI
jgi:hypothetical protein